MRSFTKGSHLAQGPIESHCVFWSRTLPEVGKEMLENFSSGGSGKRQMLRARLLCPTCTHIPRAKEPESAL